MNIWNSFETGVTFSAVKMAVVLTLSAIGMGLLYSAAGWEAVAGVWFMLFADNASKVKSPDA